MDNYRIIKDNYLKFFENKRSFNQVMLETEMMYDKFNCIKKGTLTFFLKI